MLNTSIKHPLLTIASFLDDNNGCRRFLCWFVSLVTPHKGTTVALVCADFTTKVLKERFFELVDAVPGRQMAVLASRDLELTSLCTG